MRDRQVVRSEVEEQRFRGIFSHRPYVCPNLPFTYLHDPGSYANMFIQFSLQSSSVRSPSRFPSFSYFAFSSHIHSHYMYYKQQRKPIFEGRSKRRKAVETMSSQLIVSP